MFTQDVTQNIIISEFEFLPQLANKFVQISEKFELTNFKLSDGFCKGLIINAHRRKKFVRIGESSN